MNSEIYFLRKSSFTTEITHKINFVDDTPIFTTSCRFPEIHKDEVRLQIITMLEQEIIRLFTSPWSSPIGIVPKKLDQTSKPKWRIEIDEIQKFNERKSTTSTLSHKSPNKTN